MNESPVHSAPDGNPPWSPGGQVGAANAAATEAINSCEFEVDHTSPWLGAGRMILPISPWPIRRATVQSAIDSRSGTTRPSGLPRCFIPARFTGRTVSGWTRRPG